MKLFQRVFWIALNMVGNCAGNWQPCFKRSDERYGSYATLHTAIVVIVRSGNERSVRHLKQLGLIKRGLVRHYFDMDIICDAWLSWGFQMNFMYDSVH
mmetsp:Transcript_6412/g.6915  ORF Transcript_6412/g.6915 Transcript_6412/m.6915 type:complete len:98 (+) Transcript_6412:917-1210(+)